MRLKEPAPRRYDVAPGRRRFTIVVPVCAAAKRLDHRGEGPRMAAQPFHIDGREIHFVSLDRDRDVSGRRQRWTSCCSTRSPCTGSRRWQERHVLPRRCGHLGPEFAPSRACVRRWGGRSWSCTTSPDVRRTGRILGVEGLMRWNRPRGPPGRPVVHPLHGRGWAGGGDRRLGDGGAVRLLQRNASAAEAMGCAERVAPVPAPWQFVRDVAARWCAADFARAARARDHRKHLMRKRP